MVDLDFGGLTLIVNREERMEGSELDEGLKVLESSLAHINWRLKPSSKRRLQLGLVSLISRIIFITCYGLFPIHAHINFGICVQILWPSLQD